MIEFIKEGKRPEGLNRFKPKTFNKKTDGPGYHPKNVCLVLFFSVFIL